MLKISQEEFKEWQSSYITELFFNYLIDRANDEGETIMLDFFAGSIPTSDMNTMQYIAGQARAFQEMGEITYQDIEEYYEKEIRPNTDEAAEV